MYLTLAQRVLCWITAVPLLVVAGIFASSAFDSSTPDKSGSYVGATIFLAFALAPGIPLVTYYVSGAFRKRYQRDVLAGTLQIKMVAEKVGVQWSFLAFPDRLAAPGVVVVALFLQNAHSTARVVAVSLQSNPFERGGRPAVRHRLAGGEMGVLRIPLFVPESCPAARHELKFDIEVRREGRIGARTIRRDGMAPRRLYHSRRVEVEVLGRHAGLPTNEMALEWTPFQRLYGPGQNLPDLEPIRVLESL